MVEVSFRFTPERLTEALQHHRRLHQQPRQLVWMLLIGVALIALLSTDSAAGPAGLLTVLGIVVVLVSPLIMEWFARRLFRKSPFYNEQITQKFDETGLQETSLKSDSHFDWSTYTKAAQFDDGFLLFSGPKFFRWIPNSALVNPAQIPEFEQLLRANIKEHQAVKPREKGLKPFFRNFYPGITGGDPSRTEQSKIYRWSILGFWLSFVAMAIGATGIQHTVVTVVAMVAVCSLIICGLAFVYSVAAREVKNWKNDNWRFSLKDLLIAITVVALALGGIVYVARD